MLASEWNGLCSESCREADTAAVALIDSSALCCFVASSVVAKFGLPMKPGRDIEVTLANSSWVEASTTCLVPMVVCLRLG